MQRLAAFLALTVALSLALGGGGAAMADDRLCSQLGNLVSRPTVSTTACAIGDGSVMIETGSSNQTSPGPDGAQTVTFPQVAIRDGLGRGLEVVLTPPDVERVSTLPRLLGDTDGSAGAKYQFADGKRLASAVAATYALGTGTPGLETTGEGLDVALDTNVALSPNVSLSSTFAYVTGDAGAAAPPGRTTAFEPSVGFDVSLPANLSVFAEGFGKSSSGPGTSGQYGLDGGVTYDVGSRLQLDANLFDTIGASGGRSHSVGFGAAYLFGKAP